MTFTDGLRGAAFTVLAAAIGSTGCGGPSGSGGGCHYESWQGRCTLQSVRTARVVERFPQSFVVVEALYAPESRSGEFAPPPFRKEVMAVADYEQALSNHLRQYPAVDCSVQNPIGDPCAPKMQAAVPEFLPPASGPVATGPVGCAKIEQSGGSLVPASATMPGPFQFAENSAGETPEIRKLADDAAQAMRANPRIECVAIKAKTAPGESFTLANERAQFVRHLLESRGVEHSRVTVFEATAPAYVASPDADQPPPNEQRRVYLSVVVYAKQ